MCLQCQLGDTFRQCCPQPSCRDVATSFCYIDHPMFRTTSTISTEPSGTDPRRPRPDDRAGPGGLAPELVPQDVVCSRTSAHA
eukprot:CAMPEP_0185173176 /NCGR_PEP_ID=MMETSP1139-20130426/22917_1 /TAXON_ID=298111 /ORGANISM="Pavlova sp., Strain CCMP459" /LENGTH=82 /DNA_ID=CAMNT_0027738853 /DNA_START=53 /DNA_END=298 /DNA_ORIENTATION=+